MISIYEKGELKNIVIYKDLETTFFGKSKNIALKFKKLNMEMDLRTHSLLSCADIFIEKFYPCEDIDEIIEELKEYSTSISFYNKNNTIRYNGRVKYFPKDGEILSISLPIDNLSHKYSFIISFLVINKLKEDIKEKNI
jgi:hypothetical protein